MGGTDGTMSRITLIEDTRQQHGKHDIKEQYFRDNDIAIIRSKLYVGDFARLDNQLIVVDTKKDVVEIAANICGQQHERFRAECMRAQEYGIKLVVLIEEDADLDSWQSPRKKNGMPYTHVSGKTLKKAMQTMTDKYGVEFRFCRKEEAGAKVVELLGGNYAKEEAKDE